MSLPTMTPDEKKAYEEALKRIETCRWGAGTVLDFSRLGLSHLPPEIGQLTELTELSLDSNCLSIRPIRRSEDSQSSRCLTSNPTN